MNDRIMRNTEPYHYQRNRQRLNSYPRPAQPNTRQPNQKYSISGWGQSSGEYWNNAFNDYLKRRGM